MNTTIKPVYKTVGKFLAVFLIACALIAGVLVSGVLPVRIVAETPHQYLSPSGLSAPASAPLKPAAPVTAQPPAPPTAPASPDFDMQERQDSAALVIPPKQQGRYRLAMLPDYDLTYFWHTDGKAVNMTFRGEPKKPKGTEVKEFGKLSGPRGKGFFIPPYEGNYEWCWKNPNKEPVTVQISTKGMYPDKGQVIEGKTN